MPGLSRSQASVRCRGSVILLRECTECAKLSRIQAMTGTAMSATIEQLVGASPYAGWDVVRALLCDVSEATIWERSGLWIASDAPGAPG